MNGLDVIIGMDWLSINHARINYNNKKLTFTLLNEPKLSFIGIKLRSPPLLVSAIQAMKMVNDGYSSYLASIIEPPKEEIALSDVPLVWEFKVVFPEDIPGL